MLKKKNKKSKQPSRRDRFQEALNRNISKIYLVFVTIMMVFIVLSFGAGILLRDPIAVTEYSIGTYQSNPNYNVAIIQKYQSFDETELLFTIEIEQENLSAKNILPLKVGTKFIGATNADVTTSLQRGSAHYYEFRIQQLPSSWQAVRLELSFEGTDGNLLYDFSRTPQSESFLSLKTDYLFSEKSAEVRAVQREITKVNHQLNHLLPEKISELEEEKNQLERQKIELQNETKYLTETEKQKANTSIFTIENNQSLIQGNIVSYQKQLEETRQKIELLHQKLIAVAEKNEINIDHVGLESD